MTNNTKVWLAYQEIILEDLLEDRREYERDQLATMYELDPEEAKRLETLIQSNFSTDPDPTESDAKAIAEYFVEAEHSDWDGWENEDRTTLELLLIDLKTWIKSYPKPA